MNLGKVLEQIFSKATIPVRSIFFKFMPTFIFCGIYTFLKYFESLFLFH